MDYISQINAAENNFVYVTILVSPVILSRRWLTNIYYRQIFLLFSPSRGPQRAWWGKRERVGGLGRILLGGEGLGGWRDCRGTVHLTSTIRGLNTTLSI